MLRAAGWCVSLFGAGAAVSKIFPAPWSQPVVLLAVGVAFLFVSRTRARPAAAAVTPLPARGAPPAAPAAAPVPFEQSA
jgi:hypothetical protein